MEEMRASKFYIENRLKEPSTWRAITIVLTLIGIHLEPEQVEAIITVGAVVFAIIDGFKKDANSPDA